MKNLQYFYKFIAITMFGFVLSACSVMSGRETAGQYVDDTTITARVKSAIIQHPELKARQIHVETFQGTVQLSGFIDSSKEKLKSEELARNIAGVRSVKNNLIVR
jgi:osmotically-inducible protein OsmY